jgi:hypothetical protein
MLFLFLLKEEERVGYKNITFWPPLNKTKFKIPSQKLFSFLHFLRISNCDIVLNCAFVVVRLPSSTRRMGL